MLLAVDNLFFRYNGRTVLEQVGLSVDRGELLAILGPNGVGKTTLLKCMNAIHRPTRGSVTIDGHDLFAMRPNEIASRIAYVAQRSEASMLTVFDAVLMGRKPYIRWKPSEKDLKMVHSALHHLHLEEMALRPINRLSGGELQKVMIARALVQEPGLLLFDEPTSALDLKNQVEILRLIRMVIESHRIAGIMTMHNLNSALRFAHRFLFLKNGKVHACGDIHSITPELIAEVYGLPVEIHRVGGYPVVIPVEGS